MALAASQFFMAATDFFKKIFAVFFNKVLMDI